MVKPPLQAGPSASQRGHEGGRKGRETSRQTDRQTEELLKNRQTEGVRWVTQAQFVHVLGFGDIVFAMRVPEIRVCRFHWFPNYPVGDAVHAHFLSQSSHRAP